MTMETPSLQTVARALALAVRYMPNTFGGDLTPEQHDREKLETAYTLWSFSETDVRHAIEMMPERMKNCNLADLALCPVVQRTLWQRIKDWFFHDLCFRCGHKKSYVVSPALWWDEETFRGYSYCGLCEPHLSPEKGD